MNLIGIGIISLIVYIVTIIVLNTVFKRKMSESMAWALLLLLVIIQFTRGGAIESLKSGLAFAGKQEVVYAALAFSYMSFIMNKTGIVSRLVNILNSFIGRIRGGPGYVSTIASGLFGMVSGSGSGNAAAVGSITIPWMTETGWSKESATSIVAGNAGLGIIFPPSSSMFLLLGMPAIAAELTSGDLYITLMCGALIVLAYRLILVRILYVKRDNLQPLPKESIESPKKALKAGWSSLLIFLGVLIPLLITVGPLANYLKGLEQFGKDGVKSISLIIWIPILISVIALIEGRKHLPKTAKGWLKLNTESIGTFGETGALLFFAFAASNVLANLGLEAEATAIFEVLGQYSPLLVILGVAVLITMMVGPFTGTAATTAVGSVAYLALRSINVAPAIACTVLLMLFSNEGCMPPNSAPIYVSCGISGLKDPSKIFRTLIVYYALPTILIACLVAGGIIPLIH